MFSKSFRHAGRVENMDDYLLSLGLWRKVIPKDGSSLYRVVAEQVFRTQAMFSHVMKACRNYIERHRAALVTHGAGPIEMKALSLLYKIDFMVFQHSGRPCVNVTSNGFKNKIWLCVSGGCHYDAIYPQTYIESAAISQSILYELLYECVFGMEEPVRIALEMIDSKPFVMHGSGVLNDGNTDKSSQVEPSSLDQQAEHNLELTCAHGSERQNGPFPYRVAKLLSPYILRNVEYDVWMENKKNDYDEDHSYFQLLFVPGDKCQVTIDGHEGHLFNAYIQELMPDNVTAVIFVEELGEKKEVLVSKLVALPKVANFDQPWRRRGKKKSFEGTKSANTSGPEGGHAFKTRQTALGGFYSGRRMRINSAGHPIRSRYFDGNAPRGQQHSKMNGNQARKDVKAYSARNWTKSRQRYNSEPGDTQCSHEGSHNVMPLLDDSAVVTVAREPNDGAEQEAPQLYWDNRDCTNVAPAGLCSNDFVNGGIVNGCGGYPVMMTSAVQQSADGNCVSVSTCDQLSQEPLLTESPPLLARHMPTQNMVSALPFFNMMIPVADNFGGPVNVSVPPSVDPSGADLPINDCPTMRFFFNIGVQYYRALTFMQQQPPAVSPFVSFPGPSLCMAAPAGHLVPAEAFSGTEDGSIVYTCGPTGLSPPPPPGMMSAAPFPLGSFVPLMPAGPVPFQLPSV